MIISLLFENSGPNQTNNYFYLLVLLHSWIYNILNVIVNKKIVLLFFTNYLLVKFIKWLIEPVYASSARIWPVFDTSVFVNHLPDELGVYEIGRYSRKQSISICFNPLVTWTCRTTQWTRSFNSWLLNQAPDNLALQYYARTFCVLGKCSEYLIKVFAYKTGISPSNSNNLKIIES